MGEVAAADKLISSIPDTAVIILPHGNRVSGAELKQIWAKTDFTIIDNHIPGNPPLFSNGTNRGQADYNNGNPMISFAIGQVVANVDESSVSAGGRGGLWVIFHELGHMTENGRSLNNIYSSYHSEGDRQLSEQFANDFARTITQFYTGTYAD